MHDKEPRKPVDDLVRRESMWMDGTNRCRPMPARTSMGSTNSKVFHGACGEMETQGLNSKVAHYLDQGAR